MDSSNIADRFNSVVPTETVPLKSLKILHPYIIQKVEIIKTKFGSNIMFDYESEHGVAQKSWLPKRYSEQFSMAELESLVGKKLIITHHVGQTVNLKISD